MGPVIRILIISLIFLNAQAFAKEFSLVAENDFLPYSGVKSGEPVGLAVEFVKEAFKSQGHTVNFISAPYARCLLVVRSGAYVGCFDTLKEEKNSDFLFHSEPLFTAKIMIFGRTDRRRSNLKVKDLEGSRVGITTGYTYGDEFESNKHIERQTAPGDQNNVDKLVLGRIDFALVYELVAAHLFKIGKNDMAGKIRSVGTIQEDKLYVSFSKIHPDSGAAIKILDAGLRVIRKNGAYAKIEKEFLKK